MTNWTLEKEIEDAMRNLIAAGRIAAVGCIYWIVFLAAGVGFFKAAVIGIAVIAMIMVSGASRFWLRDLGVIALALTVLNWSGAVPIGRWLQSLIVMIDRQLG